MRTVISWDTVKVPKSADDRLTETMLLPASLIRKTHSLFPSDDPSGIYLQVFKNPVTNWASRNSRGIFFQGEMKLYRHVQQVVQKDDHRDFLVVPVQDHHIA